MNDHRGAMNKALKDILVPMLRAKGFKGSFPHFRRVLPERVDYLSVQYLSSGGSFVVEIATAGSDGKPQGYGKNLPIEKLNVHFFSRRLRLGSDQTSGRADHWYKFGPRSYGGTEPVHPFEYYLEVAKQVISDFERQGESWFISSAGGAERTC